MKNKLIILMLAIGTFIFSSCKEDHDHKHDESSINIEFLKPNANQEFDKGDTIFIKANVKSDNDLHLIYLEAEAKTGNSILLSKEIHAHEKEKMIEDFFVHNLSQHSNVVIRIRTTDHNNIETARKEVIVHCHE